MKAKLIDRYQSKKAPVAKIDTSSKSASAPKNAIAGKTSAAPKSALVSFALRCIHITGLTCQQSKVNKAAVKEAAAAKKAPALKKAPAPKKPAAPKVAPKRKVLPAINKIPTQKLDIFVFGEGSAGELGLGAKKYDGKKPMDVKRPRINHLLSAKSVGVVALAVGGMHTIALTHDNKLLSWGVNDQGALGRETPQEGKMKDITKEDDSDSDSDDESEGLNPSEAEPREIDSAHFPEGTKFAFIAASDSASFVVTDEGLVYGWGTFRVISYLSPNALISDVNRATMAFWVSRRALLLNAPLSLSRS
jgi:regulator of chromosome condensation